MVDIKMNVKGMRELEGALIALQKEYGGKAATQAMRPAMKAAMAPLVSDVAGGTPVDSGDLRDSTKVKIGKPTKKMVSSSAHYNSTTIIYGQVGWYWSGKSLWTQALAVEFGTQELPANEVLRGTFDRENAGMVQRFKDTLGPSIEKKAKSLAKKRTK